MDNKDYEQISKKFLKDYCEFRELEIKEYIPVFGIDKTFSLKNKNDLKPVVVVTESIEDDSVHNLSFIYISSPETFRQRLKMNPFPIDADIFHEMIGEKEAIIIVSDESIIKNTDRKFKKEIAGRKVNFSIENFL